MSERDDFENHMRKLNPCVRLARQTTDGTYRTTSVERAWHLWQEAVRQERERCARVVEEIHCHTDDETAACIRSGWAPLYERGGEG